MRYTLLIGLVLGSFCSVSNGEEAFSYEAAYKESTKSGKPLLVLVGKEGCNHCQQMKTVVIPKLQKMGTLKSVSFAIVDAKKESKLTSQLVKGEAVPRLVIYTKVGHRWDRRELTGAQSTESVKKLIEAPVLQTTFLNNTSSNNNNTSRRGRICFT